MNTYNNDSIQTVYDIAIIGAGVIGASTAMELSRYELSIALIEQENDVVPPTCPLK